ncbi:MAG: nucleoside deaminase [Balneolia bacterium]|nr:nucleoside deaminase [Balneolia bacterium]
MNTDKQMRRLIELGRREDTPYTCMILAADGEIIALAPNRVKKDADATSHAEINAIREASARRNNKDLSGCHLITTCEPCPMCASAIFWSGIRKVSWGLSIDEIAALGHRQISLRMKDVLADISAELQVEEGVLAEEVKALF